MSLDAGVAILTVVAAAGSALVAGVMFAFSTFVMAGLKRAGPEPGMRAMQGINEAAITAPFMILLFGTAVVAAVLCAITLVFSPSIIGIGWLLAGLAIYVVGNVVVTMVGNVPMNLALAKMSATASSGQVYWATYLARWTRWNHVRTVTAAAASTAFLASLFAG